MTVSRRVHQSRNGVLARWQRDAYAGTGAAQMQPPITHEASWRASSLPYLYRLGGQSHFQLRIFDLFDHSGAV